jgi:glycerol kinase
MYILAFDQGTTSSRTVVFNEKAEIVGVSQKEFTQHFPKDGWVEHDANEIWETQWQTFVEVLEQCKIQPKEIKAIGIANQRETTVVWNKKTGKPIHKAIVWQDRRTAPICEDLKSNPSFEEKVQEKTGLKVDSYFSGTKIKWLLENVEGARKQAENGDLLFGTVDSWLIWKLTDGKVHSTDYTNASRTMVFNIRDLKWEDELLASLEIPKSMMPEVYPNLHDFGCFEFEDVEISILAVAGDQHAALFGQACFEKGMAKNTYGTGCFMLMNTGNEFKSSVNGLLTTIAFALDGTVNYALEGSVFMAGAAIQWLRDGLEIIEKSSEVEALAENATGDEVIVVPAFVGLGAPYWDMYARGAIFGLTRNSGKAEIAKATLQSMAYQSKDVLDAMQKDSGIELQKLKVDGGASANNYLMQFQANMLNTLVERPKVTESTAMGVAFMAGIQSGVWTKEDVIGFGEVDREFKPNFEKTEIEQKYANWQKAVERTRGWLK